MTFSFKEFIRVCMRSKILNVEEREETGADVTIVKKFRNSRKEDRPRLKNSE